MVSQRPAAPNVSKPVIDEREAIAAAIEQRLQPLAPVPREVPAGVRWQVAEDGISCSPAVRRYGVRRETRVGPAPIGQDPEKRRPMPRSRARRRTPR